MSDAVNVINPSGDLVSLPAEQVQQAVASGLGYRQATPEDIQSYQNEQQYGGTVNQLKTAGEGALSAATFGLGTGLETALGVKPEDIRGRAETNPGSRQIGQVAGLVGPNLIPGLGEAADAQTLMSGAGDAAAHALGLGGADAVSKVGSMAVKGAIENSMFQGGDEVSKMFYKDPDQTAQTALLNIGLSGILGGGVGAGFGAVSPIWKATVGDKLGGFLDAFQKRANGESIAIPSPVQDALTNSGMDVAPELRAGLSGDPELDKQFNILRESSTTPGQKLQGAIDDFQENAGKKLIEAVGKTPEDVMNYSENKQGHDALDIFKQEFQNHYGPIDEEYNKVTAPFADARLDGEAYGSEGRHAYASGASFQDKIAENISQMAEANGYNSPSSPAKQALSYVLERLPKMETLADIKNLQSELGQMTFAEPALRDFGKKLSGVMLDAQNEFLQAKMGGEGSDLFNRFLDVRKRYSDFSKLKDSLSSELGLGKTGGAKDFLMKLDQKRSPEEFLKKLSPKGNADLVDTLRPNFQGTLAKVQENETYKFLKPAVMRGAEGKISPKTLFNAIDKLSPEMRDFVLSKEAQAKIGGIKTLVSALPDYHSSNTAKHLDSLWSKVPGGAMAMASMLMGHNPAAGFAIGQAGKWLTRDAPDAIRLAMLKFLGKEGPVDAGAFKAAVDFAQNAIKGEGLLNKAVTGVFKAGKEVLPQNRMPDQKTRDRLDKKVTDLNQNPQSLFEQDDKTGYYLPEHSGAMGKVASKAVSFLNSVKPDTGKLGILNSNRVPTSAEEHEYRRALDIAEQPLMILHHLKEGTIIPHDLVVLHSLHPELYQRMSEKLMDQVTEMQQKGENIPYSTRLGLSMFLGQDLDASLQPQNIQMAMNQAPGEAQQQMAQQGGPKAPRAGNKAALSKMANADMTPLQARQQTKGTPA